MLIDHWSVLKNAEKRACFSSFSFINHKRAANLLTTSCFLRIVPNCAILPNSSHKHLLLLIIYLLVSLLIRSLHPTSDRHCHSLQSNHGSAQHHFGKLGRVLWSFLLLHG